MGDLIRWHANIGMKNSSILFTRIMVEALNGGQLRLKMVRKVKKGIGNLPKIRPKPRAEGQGILYQAIPTVQDKKMLEDKKRREEADRNFLARMKEIKEMKED